MFTRNMAASHEVEISIPVAHFLYKFVQSKGSVSPFYEDNATKPFFNLLLRADTWLCCHRPLGYIVHLSIENSRSSINQRLLDCLPAFNYYVTIIQLSLRASLY